MYERYCFFSPRVPAGEGPPTLLPFHTRRSLDFRRAETMNNGRKQDVMKNAHIFLVMPHLESRYKEYRK
jgi:hypothetical protein